MKEHTPGSRLLLTGILLTIAGGFLDAYTYVTRGGVFSNAQTGNIVKLSMCLANGDFARAYHFLMPILAFVAGVLVALIIETHHMKHDIPHVRRTVLIIEMATLVAVSFMSDEFNTLANIMISFVCAMQITAFKQFAGEAFATTMSTGNLRKLVNSSYQAFHTKEKEDINRSLIYLVIILSFVAGGVLGCLLTKSLGNLSVYVPVSLMLVCFIIITIKRKIHEVAE